MKKIIIIYGLIAGIIASSMFVINHSASGDDMNFENGMLLGYASMVVAFSLIFFAVKNFRDNHADGTITFGKAFKIGILITLVASFVYATSWEVYSALFAPDFMEQYTNHSIKQLEAGGASAQEIEATKAEMARYVELYKNPLIRFAMTLMEILPVGLVITLFCSLVLKRKQQESEKVGA